MSLNIYFLLIITYVQLHNNLNTVSLQTVQHN